MVEAVIRTLIGLCLLVMCVVLVVWVLSAIGLVIPHMALQILWVIVALVALLIIVRALRPFAGGWLP